MLPKPVTTPTTPAVVMPVPPMPPFGAGVGRVCCGSPESAGRPVPPIPPSELHPRAATALPVTPDQSAKVRLTRPAALSRIAFHLLRSCRVVHRFGVEIQAEVHAPESKLAGGAGVLLHFAV